MKCFPQLRSGCLIQRPFGFTRSFRSPRVETAGGRIWRLQQDESSYTLWELQLQGLLENEKDALEQLFGWAGGGLREFAFFDPLANLFLNSEDLTASSWSNTAAMAISVSGQEPGRGTTWSITNGSVQPGELWQSLPCEGGFRFCSSAELRVTSSGWAKVFSGEESSHEVASGEWVRVSATGAATGEFHRCGIRISSGAVVEVRELQVEPQMAPSEYKEGQSQSGIYLGTRFADDRLELVATAPGFYSTKIRLISSVTR